MLYDIHRILKREHTLLSALHEMGDQDTAVAPSGSENVLEEILSELTDEDRRKVKNKIRNHMNKIQRLKNARFDQFQSYLEGMQSLEDDGVTQAMQGPTANEFITMLETELQNIPLEDKKEAVRKLGPVGALKSLVKQVFKPENFAFTILQLTAVILILACLIQVFTVSPKQAMEQRLYGMVTTGDFLQTTQECTSQNYLTDFAKAATFQGNKLFLNGDWSVSLLSDRAVDDTVTLAEDYFGVEIDEAGVKDFVSFPLSSSKLLEKMQAYASIRREIRYEREKIEAKRIARRTAVRETEMAILDTVVDGASLLVNPMKGAEWTVKKTIKTMFKTFGSNWITRLMNNKLDIAKDVAEGSFKYAAAELKNKLKYEERMNEGISKLIDSIVSSIIMSALIQAAAYMAKMKDMEIWSATLSASARALYYYRIANVFIYSFLLTLADTTLNEGIDLLANYTGITMLKYLEVGHVTALVLINSINGYSGLRSILMDGFNGVKGLGLYAKRNIQSLFKRKRTKLEIKNERKKLLEDIVGKMKQVQSLQLENELKFKF